MRLAETLSSLRVRDLFGGSIGANAIKVVGAVLFFGAEVGKFEG